MGSTTDGENFRQKERKARGRQRKSMGKSRSDGKIAMQDLLWFFAAEPGPQYMHLHFVVLSHIFRQRAFQ